MRASRPGRGSARQIRVLPRSKLHPDTRVVWLAVLSKTKGRTRARLQTVRVFAFQWSSGHTLVNSLARITWPSSRECLVSEGHPATNRNASSHPDAKHVLLAAADPKALRTPNLLTQPRKPLRRWTCVSDLYPSRNDPLLRGPHHSNALPVSSCSHMVRPGALTIGSWARPTTLTGTISLFLHCPVSDALPRPHLAKSRLGRDDSTTFSGVFVRAEPALPYSSRGSDGEETINTHVGSAHTRKELNWLYRTAWEPESWSGGAGAKWIADGVGLLMGSSSRAKSGRL